MNDKPVEILDLGRNLKLEIYDRSRLAAGDRWNITFVASVKVDVTSQNIETDATRSISLDELRRVLGDVAKYQYETTRNFVDVKEKQKVFGAIKKDFLATTLGYLTRPDFPTRIILSEYRKAKANQAWKRMTSENK